MKHGDLRYDIEFEFGDLCDEETRAGQVCPACKGGGEKEGSLSVSRRGGVLLWNCHRASCCFSGAITVASDGSGRDQRASTKGGSRGHYIPSAPIDKATAGFLATKYGIPNTNFELAGLRWTGENDGTYGRRVCFPIYGPDSKERGASYRSYQGAHPKSIILLRDDDAVSMCWYRWRRTSNSLILVEDQLSALRMAPHMDAVALLGVNLSEAKVMEIIDTKKYDNIYLCLDNDATMEAIKTQLRWRHKLPMMQVRGLGTDIKDMSNEQFDKFLADVSPRKEPSASTPVDSAS